MGRGNWFAGSLDNPGSLVYVDLSVDHDDDDFASVLMNERLEEFEEYLKYLLPKSFNKIDYNDWQARVWRENFGYRNDDNVIFANQHIAVVRDSRGEYFHLGYEIALLPDQGPLAEASFKRLNTQAIWDKVSRYFKLSRRTSAWTSAPYITQGV